ncbi:dTDP-glucose 4,6-dehydratase [Magnetovibrio sp.]|uniref:dTDP-glucose 4,6-dehydratase n=1 Tax=Magnetovibrio sp. TaxID=2024836 RepID=UPI002F93096B
MKVLVTGGAGFIGSAVCRNLVLQKHCTVVNVDKLTYAANLASVEMLEGRDEYTFIKADICDRDTIRAIFSEHRPNAVLHLAAESHVDRSIDSPDTFIQSNIVGTYELLQAAYIYWRDLTADMQRKFRFLHVSTDEVYGSLGEDGAFNELSPYRPNSPYSASKAASDHLAHAWFETYGLPVMVSTCTNNYGPYQFPEKLIPRMIINALEGRTLPVYGQGLNRRDWLHVEDHAEALYAILTQGRAGETYAIGANNDCSNIALVKKLCVLMDELADELPVQPTSQLISFVTDRPGHDFRYAIDAQKITAELGWMPRHTLDDGLRQVVQWYLDNRSWWGAISEQVYDGERLGVL